MVEENETPSTILYNSVELTRIYVLYACSAAGSHGILVSSICYVILYLLPSSSAYVEPANKIDSVPSRGVSEIIIRLTTWTNTRPRRYVFVDVYGGINISHETEL